MAADLVQLTALAQRGGPFFFSVLYDVFISRWAIRSYREVCTRTVPPPSKDEKSTHHPASAKCIADRLSAQADTSMPGKAKVSPSGNQVTTYSYSKAWVAGAASTIELCSGTPMFGRAMFKSAS